MKRPIPAKSRKTADRPRVTIREDCDHDKPIHAPSHNAGIFDDSGYSAGRGQFGFRHDITNRTGKPR